ncbi:MAG: hypothetical protein GW772_07195 [Flavobacteriia bacterium]|nr:hypothetical protein [Flavobacteriia bacterium]OIP47834.1 MAG: hypothetical protein AUK46_03325 [Flavobacteriaceae bacterium CG2_30_31_66]PIV97198.1 MAG: hypothetical protein COW43_04015 [Flavobacteriaceae bacterium CG17_big_fil_post_rev_8_21_14_2_50_31_13]PIX13366.1 MAG: hypothetical protein COZ74_06605 [Flavobacteriaceae bacterium CG_4_8_14_3_um_filter_31_8]PIY15872.1 MAG: hypothetical protein COZ16_02305 [Flavobacteriaceae bacterium CG_4_10_14_3_um_filter_31_253]PIZ12267.1 MAG: hypotheti
MTHKIVQKNSNGKVRETEVESEDLARVLYEETCYRFYASLYLDGYLIHKGTPLGNHVIEFKED